AIRGAGRSVVGRRLSRAGWLLTGRRFGCHIENGDDDSGRTGENGSSDMFLHLISLLLDPLLGGSPNRHDFGRHHTKNERTYDLRRSRVPVYIRTTPMSTALRLT